MLFVLVLRIGGYTSSSVLIRALNWEDGKQEQKQDFSLYFQVMILQYVHAFSNR